MIKVLQVTGALRRNGTETFMMNVFRNINREIVTFDFLLYEKVEDGYEEEARELGANIYYYSPRKNGLKAYHRTLEDFFKTHSSEYNAIHYNGNSFSEVLPIKLAKKYGIPVRIAHSHNSMTFGLHNKLLHSWNKRHFHKIATHMLACSQPAREWGFGNTKSYEKSMIIPNGIDMRYYEFSPLARKEIREELGIEDSTLTICNTAAFRPVKNHPFLVRIFHEVKKRNKNSVLLLCGQGGIEDEIRVLVNELGLNDSVKFLGIRKDINRLLSASDVFVFPSFYEGLPFSLIEAQASGLPVLSSDKVSHEIKLTKKLEFMSIDEQPSIWAEHILKTPFTGRNVSEESNLKFFDIANTCRILENIYSNKQSDHNG